MKINWLVRLKNKTFWLSAIPALFLLIQAMAAALGFTLDLGDLSNKILAVVNAAFALLSIFGVVNDPTTIGMRDSDRAMTYKTPNNDSTDER